MCIRDRFSPADLENVLNEAALLTARRDGKTIMMEELEEAVTKVMAGPAKKSRVVTEKERKLTAYHEAGHAVLIRNLPNSDPVHQVTIIPRGMAGGMTMFLPQEDRSYESQNHMMESLVHLLGGRAAEALVPVSYTHLDVYKRQSSRRRDADPEGRKSV